MDYKANETKYCICSASLNVVEKLKNLNRLEFGKNSITFVKPESLHMEWIGAGFVVNLMIPIISPKEIICTPHVKDINLDFLSILSPPRNFPFFCIDPPSPLSAFFPQILACTLELHVLLIYPPPPLSLEFSIDIRLQVFFSKKAHFDM